MSGIKAEGACDLPLQFAVADVGNDGETVYLTRVTRRASFFFGISPRDGFIRPDSLAPICGLRFNECTGVRRQAVFQVSFRYLRLSPWRLCQCARRLTLQRLATRAKKMDDSSLLKRFPEKCSSLEETRLKPHPPPVD